MRQRLAVSGVGLMVSIGLSAVLSAQNAAPARPGVPDLSGDWAMGLGGPGGGIGQSLSAADPAGRQRGKEPDIPYLPNGLAKTMSEVPPTGPDTVRVGSTSAMA